MGPFSENGNRDRKGFTLVELLMVIVVIGILVAIMLPVLNPSRDNAKKKQQALDRETIAVALKTYEHEFMKWPATASGVPLPLGTYADDNYKVLDVLTSGKIKFIKRGAYRQTENGSIKDPYGDCYSIEFNTTNAFIDGIPVNDY